MRRGAIHNPRMEDGLFALGLGLIGLGVAVFTFFVASYQANQDFLALRTMLLPLLQAAEAEGSIKLVRNPETKSLWDRKGRVYNWAVKGTPDSPGTIVVRTKDRFPWTFVVQVVAAGLFGVGGIVLAALYWPG
jgi:hypothetical protein